ncbi:hypothetical protein EII25_03520 [Erysipelotrichaceae bacterium OH741_COT-311]|nr:hypothetical protein [Erysipelotrichaceae bacterium]RRC92756.1 hypothetical protein EII25_03520 [Erysipelotrichaceae bacterium OH741_COT-311]
MRANQCQKKQTQIQQLQKYQQTIKRTLVLTKAEETVKTFTQEEVNAILAKERKNIEKKGEARKC